MHLHVDVDVDSGAYYVQNPAYAGSTMAGQKATKVRNQSIGPRAFRQSA